MIVSPTDSPEGRESADALLQELMCEIHRLQRVSTRGFMALALFLVVSSSARWDFIFLPSPEVVSAFLGKPPSARSISMVLILYTFSALLLSLSRMTAGIEHRSSFCHVGFLGAFFLFYYFAAALDENFWAVFGSGVTILGVESYRIWSYCAEAVSQKKEDIDYVTRTGKAPPHQ